MLKEDRWSGTLDLSTEPPPRNPVHAQQVAVVRRHDVSLHRVARLRHHLIRRFGIVRSRWCPKHMGNDVKNGVAKCVLLHHGRVVLIPLRQPGYCCCQKQKQGRK